MTRKLPWRIQDDFYWAFCDADGVPIGECYGSSNDGAVAKENAARILQAVNAYYSTDSGEVEAMTMKCTPDELRAQIKKMWRRLSVAADRIELLENQNESFRRRISGLADWAESLPALRNGARPTGIAGNAKNADE